METLNGGLLTLLEAAQSEAKRSNAERPTAIHVAIALARRSPDEIDTVFGEGASGRLRQRIGLPRDKHDARELLAQATSADPAAVASLLADVLPDLKMELSSQVTSNGSQPEPAEAADAPEPDAEPALKGAARRLAQIIEPDPEVLGRDDLVTDILALLSRREPATPLVTGAAGVGKTALLGAIAQRLATAESDPPPVVRIGIDLLLGENSAAALDSILDTFTDGEIVAVDDVDAAIGLGTSAFHGAALLRLRAAVEDRRIRLLLLIDSHFAGRLETLDEELWGELTPVTVESLTSDDLRTIAGRAAQALGDHFGVRVPEQVAWLAAAPPTRHDRRVQPGLLFDRLDTACSRATQLRRDHVLDEDLGIAADSAVAPLDSTWLADALRTRVRGQDDAVERIARHLALTRAELDLRPHRPDGVFLLVGPTGVGKTELARALSASLFESEDHLIRLDMSEYVLGESITRIIGPPPGYVGSDAPSQWLTTKVRDNPRSVILLDEIEKAHPVVWNTFLQVFDAGRLTDSRGNVGDFSHTIFLLTSNIGARAFDEGSGIGFAPAEQDEDGGAKDVEGAVAAAMPPELVNRLDGVLVFRPLGDDVLVEIAAYELEQLRLRLSERGYRVEFGDGVVEEVAALGRDPRYGARHIQRNIEARLLEPLASMHGRDVIAGVKDGEIVWRERAR